MGNEGCSYESSISLSFRMCMANVLISACQKMPNSGKKPFARKVLPHLIQSMGVCSWWSWHFLGSITQEMSKKSPLSFLGSIILSFCKCTLFYALFFHSCWWSPQMIMESNIRAAFVQIFFSAVYHLKSAVLPYASELLKVSLKSLTDGSDKVRNALVILFWNPVIISQVIPLWFLGLATSVILMASFSNLTSRSSGKRDVLCNCSN